MLAVWIIFFSEDWHKIDELLRKIFTRLFSWKFLKNKERKYPKQCPNYLTHLFYLYWCGEGWLSQEMAIFPCTIRIKAVCVSLKIWWFLNVSLIVPDKNFLYINSKPKFQWLWLNMCDSKTSSIIYMTK